MTGVWRVGGVAVLAALVAGCFASTPKISQERLNVIALCNAGYNVSIGLDVEADVRALATGGPLKGGVALEQSVKGQFINDAKVSEQNAVLLYQSYVNCIQSERSLAELVAILQQRRQVLQEQMTKDGQKAALQKFETLFPLYIQQTQNNQKVAAHETGRQLQQLLASAANEVEKQTGVRPNYLLENTRSTPKDRFRSQPRAETQADSKKELPWCGQAKDRIVRDGEFVYAEREPCKDIMMDIDPCGALTGTEQMNCRVDPENWL